MHILNRHLHHEPEPQDKDKPAITIPFSMVREAIMDHEFQQMCRSTNRKRRTDDTNDEVQVSLMESFSKRMKKDPST